MGGKEAKTTHSGTLQTRRLLPSSTSRLCLEEPHGKHELGRVDREERAVAQHHSHAGDRVARQRAILEHLVEAPLGRWDVVARYVPAHDDALERRILPELGVHPHRLDHACVLSCATRPLLVRVRIRVSLQGMDSGSNNAKKVGPDRQCLHLHGFDVIELVFP